MKYILTLVILSTLISCNKKNNGWTEKELEVFTGKINAVNMAFDLFTPEQKKVYNNCVMQKITLKYKYSQVENINLKDSTNSVSNFINSTRQNCFESLLKNSLKEFNSRGIEVVIPK